MLTYLPDDLRALNHTRPPARSVRKSLFTSRIWQPVRHRTHRHAPARDRRRAAVNVNKQSADRSIAIGFLNAQSITNKAEAINETIADHSLDVLALTETWHSACDDVRLRLTTPADYAVTAAARSTGRGGGVAIIYRRHMKCSQVSLPPCHTFEPICLQLTTSGGPIVLLNIYRPGSVRPSASFFDELSSVLEVLVTFSCPVLVGGDINIHVQDTADVDARHLHELLTSFDMTQHVDSPTHRLGGTLDLVMTFADYQVTELCVDPSGIISDHSLVYCRLPTVADPAPSTARLVRSWRQVDRDTLRRALEESALCQPISPDASVDALFDTYDTVLSDIADRFAPLHTVRRHTDRRAPWFDADCREARCECRRYERRYWKTGSVVDRRQWVDATRRRFRLYRRKKEAYWTERVSEAGRSPAKLWGSLSVMLGKDRDVTSATDHTADEFAEYFTRKVDNIRADTADTPAPVIADTATSSWSSFRPTTEAEVRRIIMSSPVKSCSLDPMPTFLIREFVDLLTPYVTAIVNSSLSQGRLPESHKLAIVSPHLKKPGLDTADMANFRPVSNLSFLSKVVERAVARQLNDHIVKNGLLPRCQSAYRRHHSTETAMLRVVSDALTAADNRHVTLLGLLDMSAAFDCVDHQLLLQRLEKHCGLQGGVLRWITSYLTGRTQKVLYSGSSSETQRVCYGVPQGSVLGPLLFNLYSASLSSVVSAHGLNLHQYADDCQIYLSVPLDDAPSAATRLSQCIADIAEWLSASRLRLNPDKTVIMWLGSKHQVEKVTVHDIPVLQSSTTTVDTARDLGVMLDSQLTMSAQVGAVCRSAYNYLRQLRPVVRALSVEAKKTVVHAFVSSRLDYCNSLLSGVTDSLVQRLQAVQNAAARLVTGTRRCEHITPVLRQLHWLPVRQRIEFKMAVLVYKALNDLSPQYLADDCQLTTSTGRRRLRSSNVATCDVPRTRTSLGDRSFTAAGPRLWNNLPLHLRDFELSLLEFRRLLKTHLFS